jgi:truncated hemoglobin YjbI/ankyrin repeat protein
VTFASLEHRCFLNPAVPLRKTAESGLFTRIGGQPAVDRLVDALYDGFESDEILRPLFGRDLERERSNQKRFFAEWLGGPARYGDSAYAGLAHRHENLGITPSLARRWLGHLRGALAVAVASEADREQVWQSAQTLAFALAGLGSPTPDSILPGDAHCGRRHPAIEAARLAQRGEVDSLRNWLAERPEALRPATKAAMVLHAATVADRVEVVELLLGEGVDVDKPFFLAVGLVGLAFERVLFVTPLCAARSKRRRAVEAVLGRAGARGDVFTAAFLGDLDTLDEMLASDPSLAQASDPATDVVEITPVHHAVAGGQVDALRRLLGHTSIPLLGGTRALRGAASQPDAEMVRLLLARGASAATVGPGRWVLHPEIAPLLARAGASAGDAESTWVGASCTGNQGRKDDPDYVHALLQHGARAGDRRAGATALHYASRAGFLNTIEVLLKHGAERNARDDEGLTPLDWLQRAAKTVDRAAVRRVLNGKRWGG